MLGSISFSKIRDGLSKTREKFISKINEAVTGKVKLDIENIERIEEILISSDIGYDTTEKIIENLKISLKGESNRTEETAKEVIKNELVKIIESSNNNYSKTVFSSENSPFVILVVGVNGVGKTTTIGKLAYNFKNTGKKVIIGSGDTFRAAANDQLDIWSRKAGVEIIQSKKGTDPSSVVYDTIQTAKQKNFDIVLIDTAGRLHTKIDLMEELGKIQKTIKKIIPNAPNEIFIVLDATSGQNALKQVQEFKKYTAPTGLIVTKLDGTAKGGVIFQICSEFNIPIKYIGVGEQIDDLQVFDSNVFVTALFAKD